MTEIFAAVIILIGIIGFTFLFNAVTVWALVWALNAIGITAICGVPVQFSWPLVIAITLIISILRGIFGKVVKGE